VIPQKIWQTWKSHQLPERVRHYVETWKSKNPGWTYAFHDDEECREDVRVFGGADLLNVYDKMPLPVMKADIWRYLIIHEHGGVYADIDTSCNRPLDLWIPSDAKFVVALENAMHLCQWTFAAEAKHPALDRLLRLVIDRARGGVEMRAHAVHYYTGPGVFTSALNDGRVFRIDPSRPGQANDDGFHVFPNHTVNGDCVSHHFGGQWSDTPGYTAWTIQQNNFVAKEQVMEQAFSKIYRDNVWGGSGPGSTPEYCAPFAGFLVDYIKSHSVKSVCDLGCGDLQWAPSVVDATDVQYIGLDCVRSLIDRHGAAHCCDDRYEFQHADLSQSKSFPEADLYIIKDVLQHWPSDDVATWLNNFFGARPSARLLVINCVGQRGDRVLDVGGWAPLDHDKYPMSTCDGTELFAWRTKKVTEVRPRAELKSLECVTVTSGELARIGRAYDGGYVIVDGIGDYDGLFSGGVGDDVSFERALLSLHPNLRGDVFDGSVSGLPGGPHDRLLFHREFIGPGKADLRKWICDKENAFVKLDIEGGEVWQIRALAESDMMRVKQAVIEFHEPWLTDMDILMKMRRTHDLVHIHANNCSKTRKHLGATVPCVFEATYVRRQPGATRSSVKLPRDIDMPNGLGGPDIVLSGYPWP
jgi:hypothetical protein